ncbi:MAG: helix-turn-helix domain-containing protein [Fidelibacterota bacterium]
MKEIVGVRFYFVEEIARELGLNEKTVRRYLKSGKLEGLKLGKRWLVSERAFHHFLNNLNISPNPPRGISAT